MSQGQLGRIMIVIGILLGAYAYTQDVVKALALGSMIVGACALIRVA